MTEDPTPYVPATEYNRFRKNRDNRAKKDNRTREQLPPSQTILKEDIAKHEDTDICPLRKLDGFCKESETEQSEGLFHCISGKSYMGCGIYLKWYKKLKFVEENADQ